MPKFMKRSLMAVLVVLFGAVTAMAQSPYKLRTGDTLQFEVLEDASLNRSLLVLPDGSVSVPLVGSISAAGRSLADLRGAIVAGLSSSFASAPTVFLSVGSLAERPAPAAPRTIQVFVMGEVNKPGALEAEPGLTLLQALALSGGPSKFASTKRLQLHRDDGTGQQQSYQFNYKAITEGMAQGRATVVLRDGDVIILPARRLFE